MPQPIVLIIFSCNTGDTEKLALSAAVGAIQARALIRLRRLQDPDSSETTEALSRMQKEYVPPTDKDILGADVVILVSNATADCSTNPWQSLVALLRKLHAEKMLEGKVGAAFGGIGPSMAELGFTSEENAMMDAVAFGRSLADKTRASKPQ